MENFAAVPSLGQNLLVNLGLAVKSSLYPVTYLKGCEYLLDLVL
jgi:hypothetical protein